MFYKESDLEKIKKQSKRGFVVLIVFFVLVIGYIIGTSFCLNDDNILYIQIGGGILASLFVCFFIYFLINSAIPSLRYNRLLFLLMNSPEKIIDFEKATVNDVKTINHTEKAYLVELVNGKDTHYVYLDVRFKEKLTDLENSKRVKVRNNYIVEIM